MELFQVHVQGYLAPVLYLTEEQIKEKIENRSLLSARFPEHWRIYFTREFYTAQQFKKVHLS